MKNIFWWTVAFVSFGSALLGLWYWFMPVNRGLFVLCAIIFELLAMLAGVVLGDWIDSRRTTAAFQAVADADAKRDRPMLLLEQPYFESASAVARPCEVVNWDSFLDAAIPVRIRAHWTKEIPAETGHYWIRNPVMVELHIVKIDHHGPGNVEFTYQGNEQTYDHVPEGVEFWPEKISPPPS